MKNKVWEKRYRAERQKLVGAALAFEEMKRKLRAQEEKIEWLYAELAKHVPKEGEPKCPDSTT